MSAEQRENLEAILRQSAYLLFAVGQTDIVCVQNQLNVVDRASMPVLEECYARMIIDALLSNLDQPDTPSLPQSG